jgi:hypothetical protein
VVSADIIAARIMHIDIMLCYGCDCYSIICLSAFLAAEIYYIHLIKTIEDILLIKLMRLCNLNKFQNIQNDNDLNNIR